MLFELFEGKLEKHNGQMIRAAVELAKEWRSDRALRRLEALLCVANEEASLIISGNGDVIEPEDSLMASWLRRCVMLRPRHARCSIPPSSVLVKSSPERFENRR